MLWTPAAWATLSFVPTPSVHETRTGSWYFRAKSGLSKSSRNSPANPPSSGNTRGVNVRFSSLRQARHRLGIDFEIDARIFVSGFGHRLPVKGAGWFGSSTDSKIARVVMGRIVMTALAITRPHGTGLLHFGPPGL